MMGKMFLGTEPTAARIPGYVGVAVMLAIDVVYIMHAVKKADKNGMHWDGEEAGIEMPPPTEKDKVHPVLALIPMLWIFITVTVLGLDMVVCMFFAIIMCSILFANGLKPEGERLKLGTYNKVLGDGCTQTAGHDGLYGRPVCVWPRWSSPRPALTC